MPRLEDDAALHRATGNTPRHESVLPTLRAGSRGDRALPSEEERGVERSEAARGGVLAPCASTSRASFPGGAACKYSPSGAVHLRPSSASRRGAPGASSQVALRRSKAAVHQASCGGASSAGLKRRRRSGRTRVPRRFAYRCATVARPYTALHASASAPGQRDDCLHEAMPAPTCQPSTGRRSALLRSAARGRDQGEPRLPARCNPGARGAAKERERPR